MSGFPQVSLDEEIEFLKSVVIPSFAPRLKFGTDEEKRAEWMQRKAEKFLALEKANELMDRFSTISSLEKAEEKLLEAKQERQQLQSLSGLAVAPLIWNVNKSPHRVLGDDQDGPHSSAIIVGRRTVVGCAHSLGLLIDESMRNTKSKTHYTYLEDYWIQPYFTKNIKGEFTTDGRVPLKLYKFHVENDWALFVRVDGQLFAEDEVAAIDKSLITNPSRVVGFNQAIVLHCPVALKAGIRKTGEFNVGCQTSTVHVQVHSTHHVKYEGRNFCRGSSGGGVYVYPSTSVLGMHIEAINEAEFDAEDDEKIITYTDKRVHSEADPYLPFETDGAPAAKKMKSETETIASIAGGNNGLRSALIFCKFSRLMYYIDVLEKEFGRSIHKDPGRSALRSSPVRRLLDNDELEIISPSAPPSNYRGCYYEVHKKDWEKAAEDYKKCADMLAPGQEPSSEDKAIAKALERVKKELQRVREKEKKMWGKAFA